ncbi:MAG: class B sortase [Anaerovoracaceae bacterium]
MIRKILLVIFIIIFLVSGFMLGKYLLQNYKAESTFTKLRPKEMGGKSELSLEELYGKNNDLVGWIKVPNTKIDYPVMQTKDDEEFYLRRNFEKSYSLAGTPFMSADSELQKKPSGDQYSGNKKVWVIYGHNMQSGIMFHDLEKYLDKDFLEKNNEITFTYFQNVDEDPGLQKTENKPKVGEAFNLIKKVKKFRVIKVVDGVDKAREYVSPEDKQILILSTCDNITDDGRITVIAEKI